MTKATEKKHEKLGLPFANWIYKKKINSFFSVKKIEHKYVKYFQSVCQSFAKFTGTLAITCLFYTLLQLWLDLSNNITKTGSTIFEIENAIRKIQLFIKPLKITSGWDIIVVTLLIGLAGGIPFLEKYKVKERYSKAMKIPGTILQLLTVVTSFTFFGSRFYEGETGNIGKLQMHRLEIIKENKLLVHEAAEQVINEVANSFMEEQSIKSILDDASLLNYRLDNPVALNNSDSLGILLDIEKLKPLVTEKLKSITEKHTFDFDFEKSLEKTDQAFFVYPEKNKTAAEDFIKSSYIHTSTTTSFKPVNHTSALDDAIDNNLYKSIDNITQGGIAGKNVSLGDILEARASLQNIKDQFPEYVKAIPYMDKFEESLKKLVKFGLSKTANKWIGDFFENLAESNPFIGNLIDPLINDPVKEYITNKTISLIKNSMSNNTEKAIDDIYTIRKDMSVLISENLPGNQKIKNLYNKMKETSSVLAEKKSRLLYEIYSGQKAALEKFELIKSAGRFAKVREDYYQMFKNGSFNISEDAKVIMESSLDDWYKYLEEHKLEVGLSSYEDAEHFFADYCHDTPDMAATWGFILKSDNIIRQEIELKYSQKILEQPGGLNPGIALIYYFEKFGYKEQEVVNDIINPADKLIGIICKGL